MNLHYYFEEIVVQQVAVESLCWYLLAVVNRPHYLIRLHQNVTQHEHICSQKVLGKMTFLNFSWIIMKQVHTGHFALKTPSIFSTLISLQFILLRPILTTRPSKSFNFHLSAKLLIESSSCDSSRISSNRKKLQTSKSLIRIPQGTSYSFIVPFSVTCFNASSLRLSSIITFPLTIFKIYV